VEDAIPTLVPSSLRGIPGSANGEDVVALLGTEAAGNAADERIALQLSSVRWPGNQEPQVLLAPINLDLPNHEAPQGGVVLCVARTDDLQKCFSVHVNARCDRIAIASPENAGHECAQPGYDKARRDGHQPASPTVPHPH
jgi:hypothetical protein